MQKRNYQAELEQLMEQLAQEGRRPTLLVHACCGPCNTKVLDTLAKAFAITVLFYNPNIHPRKEYDKRCKAQADFIAAFNDRHQHDVQFVEGKYDPRRFFEATQGLGDEPEKGKRCEVCYELRLQEAKKFADELGCEYYTTSLTVSPYKNTEAVNRIGDELDAEALSTSQAKFLHSDFKKKNGFRESVELAKEYGLYRQNYCGCIYSYTSRFGAMGKLSKENIEKN
ncbi:MAG: epoxyqueuosine reductase QueH [Culicoidibacterales bacterium]